MKNRKNQRNSLFSFAEIAVLAVLFLLFSDISAKPFILKSVDGSWLPMIAQSWVAKNGGVLVKVADGIKVSELRQEMLSKTKELNIVLSIEILGKELFFPTTTPDGLFELLKDIDLDVADSGRKQMTAESSEMFQKKSAENPAVKDEYTEAAVESINFDEKHEKIIILVKILQRAKSGAFIKLYGKYKIEHSFKKKDGIIDPSDAENMAFLPLITVKKGSKVLFIPEKNESRVLTIKPDFKIK